MQFPPTVPPAVPDGPADCAASLCELLEAGGADPEPPEPPSLEPLEDVTLSVGAGDTGTTTGVLLDELIADRLSIAVDAAACVTA